MDSSQTIIPPHLNSELYRTNTSDTNTLLNFDYIRVHADGSVLVGCSELTGRRWNGGAQVHTSSKAQNLKEESVIDILLNTGTADGCFIGNSSKVLLCEDSGAVSIWANNETDVWKIWNEELSVSEHDDAVLSVDCLVSGTEYITAGADGNVKVWNISDMICIRNYNAAHAMAIYGVAVKPKSVTCFATASADQYITLWDDNISKPVNDILRNDCGIRCLQWYDDNHIIYGDEAGVLRMVDIRNTENVKRLFTFPAAVHKIAIQSDKNNIAVCCDNKTVTVLNINENEEATILYQDRTMHTNYVRGLAWNIKENDQLHTVGWNGEIRTHKTDG